jgi:hypothetical protein
MKIAITFSLLALLFSLRFASAKGWSHHKEWRADRYDCLARSLLTGRGFIDCDSTARTTYRLPGYPLVLAGLFAAFGDSEPAARLFQSVLVALIAFVAVAFTQQVG